jgi:hypothetical protein
MFQALTCPSSGGQNVLSQHLVLSLSVNSCTECQMTAEQSGITTESISSLLSSGILYSRLQGVRIPDAVIIQFVLLKIGMLMLETRRGL